MEISKNPVDSRMGYPMARVDAPGPPGLSEGAPVTIGTMLGLRPGTRIPGLLRLLKGDCPISEIVEATKTWAKNPIGRTLGCPGDPKVADPDEDPCVELPPAPVDQTRVEGKPSEVLPELPALVPAPPSTDVESKVCAYHGVWDTVDLNVYTAKTGDAPFDTLRDMNRWYDRFMLRNKVSAGGFPLTCARPHFMDTVSPGNALSAGGHLGSFSPDVRALLASRYGCVFGYAISKTIVTEGSNSLSTAALAAELGFDAPDADEVINSWAPFGYIEAIPFNNLRWGSRGKIDRLLMEGLVLVKVSMGKSAPMVFGHMGGCIDVTVSRHPGAAACTLSGTALLGRSYNPTIFTKVAQVPDDELVPSFIVPSELFRTGTMDVDSDGGSIVLIQDGATWEVDGMTFLPTGRYRVMHSGLPETDGRVKVCVTEWLSSTWLSASARLTFMAARDPQWCAMVRPAWLQVLDPYTTPGQVSWRAACHRPGSYTTAEWDGEVVKTPDVKLRSDGLFGTRPAMRAYGYATVMSVFGPSSAFKSRLKGEERDRWVGHAYRQWLLVHSGCAWIDSTVSNLIHDCVMQWNPTSASSYCGVSGHLSAMGALMSQQPLTDILCPYGGMCENAPASNPCFCKRRADVQQALVPRMDSEGKYVAVLPLTGHGLLYDSYGLPYHPASHGVRPSYVGAAYFNPGREPKWVLPYYQLRTDTNIQDKLHLDCLVFNRRRKRQVEIPVPLEGDKGTISDEVICLELYKRPRMEYNSIKLPDLVEDSQSVSGEATTQHE